MPSYQGIEDEYLPPVVKPSLQQYDNYQIYDLVCVDISANAKLKKWLAIQAYSPTAITCDFITIANQYH